MTSSVFVHDIRSPVPVDEFFLPMRDELRFPQYQDCLEREEFRAKEYWLPNSSPGNLSLMAGAQNVFATPAAEACGCARVLPCAAKQWKLLARLSALYA